MSRFELKTLTEYSDGAILEELRRVAALNPKGPLTQTVYRKLRPKVSLYTVRRRFGEWKEALDRAGLGHRYCGHPLSEKMRSQPAKKMNDDDLIAEMRRVQSLTRSDALTVAEFNHHSRSHADTLRRRFGTWKNALERAGIAQAALGRRYTDQECYENIVTLWTHYGRQPQYHELNESPSTVGPKAFVTRWGSWRKALKAFVDWANADEQDAPGESPETASGLGPEPALDGPAKPCLLPEGRHEIPLRLKWNVHLRDRFRCVACGLSPANDLTVELHVDHIYPWADGGKTVLENLQTLCKDCNLGKGKSFARVAPF